MNNYAMLVAIFGGPVVAYALMIVGQMRKV